MIHSALPEGASPGSQWAEANGHRIKIASILMPFAGMAFLWFIGVVRDGFGRFEDKFFSSVFVGSGLLFLAMIFATSAVGVALENSTGEVAAFGQALLLTLSKTYALRMGAVFMMSLATIWLKTGLMPKWLVVVTYLVAVVTSAGRRLHHLAHFGVSDLGHGGQSVAPDAGGCHRSRPRRLTTRATVSRNFNACDGQSLTASRACSSSSSGISSTSTTTMPSSS